MFDTEAVLGQMTLEEKVALCTGASTWTTTPIERLGVPHMLLSDGPHGVRRVPDIHSIAGKSLPATCFPTASCLASTWNTELLRTMGRALAAECVAREVDVLLGPGVNMKRSPLGGRNFEYFSEDPYLAGELAVSLIEGIQSQGVGTSLKHFAANNQEFERFSISAEVDERTLREIYLPAFEAAVKQAKPWTVMCAYNKLNGTYCSEHYDLLTRVLRQEWGFEGVVVSDWGAVHDRPAALRAGLDLEMPGPKQHRVDAVLAAVRSGELDEAVLDAAVRRILGAVAKARTTPKGGTFDVDAHHALARDVAAEGIVLLRNNGVLPLRGVQHLAVIGRAAQHAHFQGGGSSHINPTRVAVPFNELAARAGDAEVSFEAGYAEDGSAEPAMIERAVGLAQAADVAVLFIGLPASKESEGYDRTDLDLTAGQVALIRAVSSVQPNTVVVLNNGAPVVMGEWIDGTAAVLEAWMMGQAGGEAVAEVLFGRVNPSGKLAETFPLRLADTPAYLNWPGGHGQVRYGEGLFIGYRYYDARAVPVQFPFGFGLSYTTFAYSQARASAERFKDTEGVSVSVAVTNTGEMAGQEIVQVYVRDQQSGLVRPPKELKGFAKVALAPGETKTVTIRLDFRSFAYFHPAYHQWITESGAFDLLIGASAEDIRATVAVELESTVRLPCLLNRESTIRAWLDDPRGAAVCGPFFMQVAEQMAQGFGGSESDGGFDMDMLPMLLDMPLLSVLEWRPDTGNKTAIEEVDSLLAAAYSIELD